MKTRTSEADFVLLEGDLIALDSPKSRAEALAIHHGTIERVGDAKTISERIGPYTRVLRMGGRTVLPALTDGHAHLYGFGRAMSNVDLRGCDSPTACAARAQTAAAHLPASAWLEGRGWDQNLFSDRQFPRREALDRAIADRPVWLRRVDGHAAWGNGVALARAGITRKTADPPGGRILRTREGEPTGVFIDAAMTLVEKVIPEPDDTAREVAILRGQEKVLELGITQVHEMGIDEQTARIYRKLAQTGQLKVRVYAFLAIDDLAQAQHLLAKPPEPALPGTMFTMRGIKIFADGALGSRGAALLAAYSDDASNMGLVITPPATLLAITKLALANGWQVAVHAIGDRANQIVLDTFAQAGCENTPNHRFRIEHAQVLALPDIARFAKLSVIASMQPVHATSDMPWAPARLGAARLRGAYAWRRFLDAKATLVGGSDFPVEEVDPIRGGLYAAVTRSDLQGNPAGGWLPDQRLTFEEAVMAFSSAAAYGAFEESWRGKIAQGQAADLTILDRKIDPRSPGASLRDARVDLTMVGGRIVFDRSKP